jgi:hypothetical protein
MEEDKLLREQQELRFKTLSALMKEELARQGKATKEDKRTMQARNLISGNLADGMQVPQGTTVSYEPQTGKFFTADGNEVFNAQTTGGETPNVFSTKRGIQYAYDEKAGKHRFTTKDEYGNLVFIDRASQKSTLINPPKDLDPQQRQVLERIAPQYERITKKFVEGIQAGRAARAQLMSGNPSEQSQAMYSMARMVEVGAMTDKDVTMPMGGLSIRDFFKMQAEKAKTGKIYGPIVDRMVKSMDNTLARLQTNLDTSTNNFASRRSKSMRMDSAKLAGILKGSGEGGGEDVGDQLLKNDDKIMQKIKGTPQQQAPTQGTEKKRTADVVKGRMNELLKLLNTK